MASYSILVTSSPYSSDSARQAVLFCRELIRNNHRVDQVFFFQDGVLHANSLTTPPSDEINPYQMWTSLHKDLAIPLVVCVTAALRRGIVSKNEADTAGLTDSNLRAPFTDNGLGEFFSQLHQSDHLVQF